MEEEGDLTLRNLATKLLKSLDDEHNISSGACLTSTKVYFTCSPLLTPSGYTFDDFIKYLKQKGFVRRKRFNSGSITFSPFFIGELSGGLLLIFVYRSRSGNFCHVCEICQRGFSSDRGLGDHLLTAKNHTLGLQAEISNIISTVADDTGCVEYRCPFLGCCFTSSNKVEVERHIKQDKTKKVNMSTLVVESQVAPTLSYCELCDMKIATALLANHLAGRKHIQNNLSSTYYSNRKEQMKDKNDVEILVNGDVVADGSVDITMGDNTSQIIKFWIKNLSSVSSVTLTACSVCYDIPAVLFSDVHKVCEGCAEVTLPPGGQYEVEMNFRPRYSGRTVVPLQFTFLRMGLRFEILREVNIESVNNPTLFHLLQPKIPYSKPKKDRTDRNLEVVQSDFLPTFENNSSLQMPLKPDNYYIPSNVRNLLQMATPEDVILKELNLNKLDFSNYSEFFNNLLHLEEYQMRIDIEHYTMRDVMMQRDSRSGLLRLQVPGLAENRPSVLRGDKLFAIPAVGDGSKYQGHVHNVHLTEVFLGFHRRLRDNFIQGMKYKIEFTINRLTAKVAHRAVSWAGEMAHCSLKDVLFPTTKCREPLKSGNPELLPLTFTSVDIANNKEQQSAVKHIVAGTSRPAPYLIYGPPGTGKTFTVVEAIKQVYKEFPYCRILACAPQNAAADLMTKRLLGHIDKRHMLRVHAMSRNYKDVEEKIRGVSNYRSDPSKVAYMGGDQEIWFPSKEELQEYRIIVVTLVTSGRFVSAEMNEHFTHIFIDEAGHATEPETVIPLAGLLDVNMRNGGQLVLAGDPKQLGPVIRSSVALQGGLGMSMLERLMDTDVYNRQKSTNMFNPTHVTKLVRSFRSHPDILKVPNDCFYESELQVWADEFKRERLCHWEGLPTENFPLIFHGVNGKEQQEASSPSWFNVHEVDVVQMYVKLLMESKSPRVTNVDIGIISPYHQQANKLKQAMKELDDKDYGRQREYKKIKVGSVEKFQGDEREVIIISTVRSQDMFLTHDDKFNLGFVGNPKRFNVAVTRSKALLIVVGNPEILCRDNNWRKLIRHIRDGGGYTGCPLQSDIDSDVIDDLGAQLAEMSVAEEMFELNDESAHLQLVDPNWDRRDA